MPAWFRFYSETTADRKIERICRTLQQPKALVVGAWSILMAIGNDSPVRGVLLLTEDIAFTDADLADEMGLSLDATQAILDQFQRFSMIHHSDDVMYLTNWNKRQFASDDSSERVRRYRERKKAEQQQPGNNKETLQDRDGNAPEQNRAESEQSRSRTEPETASTAGDLFLKVRGGAVNSLDVDALNDFIQDCEQHRQGLPRGSPGANLSGDDWVKAAILEGNASRHRGKVISLNYIRAILDRWQADGYKAPFSSGGAGAGRVNRDEQGNKVIQVGQ